MISFGEVAIVPYKEVSLIVNLTLVIAALDKNCSPQHLIQQQEQQFYKFYVFLYLVTKVTYVHCLLFLIT